MRPEGCSDARNIVPVTGMLHAVMQKLGNFSMETEPERKPHDRNGVPVGRAEEPPCVTVPTACAMMFA